MTVAFPSLSQPAPNRLQWRLMSNSQVSESPLSKSVQTYELPGSRWGFTAEYTALEAADAALMQAFLAQLRGRAGRFTVHNWERATPRGSLSTGKYAVLPWSAGNYIWAPDSAALSVTGDIDIRVKCALTQWAHSPYQAIMGKYSAAGQLSWNFYITSGGNLRLQTSPDGTALSDAISSAAVGLTDLADKFLRATRAAASGSINFYLSDDGATWTQLGTTMANTAGNIFDSTSQVRISQDGSLLVGIDGKVYYAEIRNGIGGTVVGRFAASDWVSGSTVVSSVTGETWTMQSSGSPNVGIVADVARVRGASQTGGTLNTTGWKPSQTGLLLPADYFGIGSELKMASASVDSDSYGNAAISLEPPLRSSPANGAEPDFSSPEATFMLTEDVQAWEVVPGKFWSFTLSAIEAFA